MCGDNCANSVVSIGLKSRYEGLVADLETEGREVTEFLGLTLASRPGALSRNRAAQGALRAD
jgi:hypothetical protein